MAQSTRRKVSASQQPDPVPAPVETEERICFGLAWFRTEAEADAYGAEMRRQGRTFNGGYFHGMACGRCKTWDKVHPVHGKLYAVTT